MFFRKIYPSLLCVVLVIYMIPLIPPIFRYISSVSCFFFFLYFYNEKKRKIDNAYFCWLLFFYGFASLSTFWALSPKLVGWVIIMHVLPIMAILLSISMYVKSQNDILRIFKVFYIATCVVYAVVLIFADLSDLDGNRLTRTIDTGDEDKIWNSNFVGTYLALAICAGFISFWKNPKSGWFKKALYIICSLAMVVGIFLTGSRSAILALFVPIGLWYSNKKNKLGGSIIAIIIIVLGYLLIMNVPLFYSNIGYRLEDMINVLMGHTQGDEDVSRLNLVLYGLEWFKDSPLIGIGINNYRILSNQFLYVGKNFYAHNNYIEILVDLGILGVFIYYSFIFLVVKNIKKHKISNPIIVIMLITILVMDISHVSYYEPIIQITLCIMFCIMKIEKNNIILFKKVSNNEIC